ncbi:Hypothetical predicted protein [Pelobates cultripes]|uniref:Uncharacterized protein n=1 Tax=Pelobates cultripes TaxID=61616 RepID=A0AAD1SAH2_PELCU|nr:Hypothetical predicted protein [Pelobates cultripes]
MIWRRDGRRQDYRQPTASLGQIRWLYSPTFGQYFGNRLHKTPGRSLVSDSNNIGGHLPFLNYTQAYPTTRVPSGYYLYHELGFMTTTDNGTPWSPSHHGDLGDTHLATTAESNGLPILLTPFWAIHCPSNVSHLTDNPQDTIGDFGGSRSMTGLFICREASYAPEPVSEYTQLWVLVVVLSIPMGLTYGFGYSLQLTLEEFHNRDSLSLSLCILYLSHQLWPPPYQVGTLTTAHMVVEIDWLSVIRVMDASQTSTTHLPSPILILLHGSIHGIVFALYDNLPIGIRIIYSLILRRYH